MKKLTVILLAGFAICLSLINSCKKDDKCKNNLFISTITPTLAFTGQKIGTVSITTTGDTVGVTYSLNKGNPQSSSEFSNLEPGLYSIEVKNPKGCIDTQSFEIPASDPCLTIPITLSTTKTDPFTGLSNGAITVSATGGSGFSYTLNNQAPSTSGSFANLGAGTYTLSAKNSYGCTSSTQVTLTSINPCTIIKVDASYTKVDPTNNLPNGSITASAVNNPSNQGGGTFTYSLDKVNGGAFKSDPLFPNLPAGNYVLTAKNSYNCTDAIQINLVSNVNCATRVINVNGTPSPVVPCTTPVNGSITAMATGPVTPFSYSLSQNGVVVRPFSSSPNFNNLTAGAYVINARDADGCTKSSSPINVATAAAGTNFTAVKTILLSGKCSNASCHPKYGDLSSDDCVILSNGNLIYNRTITETNPSKKMPPANNLTTAEQNSIKAWFAGGLKYNN